MSDRGGTCATRPRWPAHTSGKGNHERKELTRLDRNVHAHAAFVVLLRTSLPNFLLTLLPLPFLPRTFFSRTLPLFLLTLLRLKRFLPRTSLPLFLVQSVELAQHPQHSVCVHPPPCHTGCTAATTVSPGQPRSPESIPPPDRPASGGRVRRETLVTGRTAGHACHPKCMHDS